MKRILVTGGSGFVGRHVGRYLSGHGHEVHATARSEKHFPCDRTGVAWHVWSGDREQFEHVVSVVAPHIVLHCAAMASPNRELGDIVSQYENTIRPTLAVASVVPPTVELVAFLGSCEEYGAGPVPATESQALHAISPYGWAKISAFHGTRFIADNRQLNWCWLRPYLVFGPHQQGDRLIPLVIRKCLAAGDVPLTTGDQTRDFVFISDICAMIDSVISAPEKSTGQVINLCSGVPRTIRDVATVIHAVVGRGRLLFGALPYRRNEAMAFYGSTAKYEELFGRPSCVPFEVAIRETVDWYAANTSP